MKFRICLLVFGVAAMVSTCLINLTALALLAVEHPAAYVPLAVSVAGLLAACALDSMSKGARK